MIYIVIVLFLLIATVVLQNYPVSSSPKELLRLADTADIRRDLESIINTPKSRNFKNPEILDSVAGYIRNEFLKSTARVTIQKFEVEKTEYKNVIASFGPETGERLIVGAHYDVCGEQDGADENMGSYVHARSLYDAKIPVKGMISLEMIGFYSEHRNSQSYPVGFLKWVYGSIGNYITIVQKPFNGSFPKQFKSLSFKNNSIPTKSFIAPSFFGGIDLSDHRNYWKFGYSAVMVTNTAFFRNQNYHTKEDVLQTLNVPKIGLVVDGVFRTLMEMK